MHVPSSRCQIAQRETGISGVGVVRLNFSRLLDSESRHLIFGRALSTVPREEVAEIMLSERSALEASHNRPVKGKRRGSIVMLLLREAAKQVSRYYSSSIV